SGATPPPSAGLTSPRCSRRSRCAARSEEHTSELQSLAYLVCRLLLEKNGVCPSLGCNSAWTVDSPACGLLCSCSTISRPRCTRALAGALLSSIVLYCSFFFNDTATTEIYTLSLRDALPI